MGGKQRGRPEVPVETVKVVTEDDIAEMLRIEAEASEEHRDDELNYVRNRTRAKDPSQVYSLRIPVHRLEELRLVAVAAGLEPSVLMRQWVLERLDAERSARGEATDRELMSAKLERARRLLGEVQDAMERGR